MASLKKLENTGVVTPTGYNTYDIFTSSPGPDSMAYYSNMLQQQQKQDRQERRLIYAGIAVVIGIVAFIIIKRHKK